MTAPWVFCYPHRLEWSSSPSASREGLAERFANVRHHQSKDAVFYVRRDMSLRHICSQINPGLTSSQYKLSLISSTSIWIPVPAVCAPNKRTCVPVNLNVLRIPRSQYGHSRCWPPQRFQTEAIHPPMLESVIDAVIVVGSMKSEPLSSLHQAPVRSAIATSPVVEIARSST